jgi:hypothetical protein
MQSEMAKALQTPFAPLTELARKNMELWDQVQVATREAFTGRGADAAKAAHQDGSNTQNDSSKGK